MPAGLRRRWRGVWAAFGLRQAHPDAILGLSLLAVLAGLVTGALAIAFRLITEHTLVWLAVLPRVERYEALPWEWRLGLPVVGGLLIGMLFQLAPVAARAVGPVHVMAQLVHQGGRLPWRNAVMQFVGGEPPSLPGTR